MTKSIETLKRNISLHKEIEKKLARRSHKSQRIINELKNEAEALEQDKLRILKSAIEITNAEIVGDEESGLKGEALIDFLESKL